MSSIQPVAKPPLKTRVNSAFKQLMSIHWWMAALYLLLFVGGAFMAQLERGVSFRSAMYDFHKSLGVLTMALLTWRILVLLQVWWKKYTKRLPKFSSQWFTTFALHSSLYILMWAVPVTGFFLSNSFRPNNVKFFGLVLPDIFPQNSALVDLARGFHFWFAYTFLAFILLHSIAQWKVVRANYRRFVGFIKSRAIKSSASD